MSQKKWLTDEEYDFVFDRVPRLCVDLVIRSDKGIALSLRDIEPHKGLWHLPGGMIYKAEPLETAAKRIAKRETGFDVAIRDILGHMEFLNEIQSAKERHTVSIVLHVEPVAGDMAPDFQSKKIQFWTTLPKEHHPVHGAFLVKKKILK